MKRVLTFLFIAFVTIVATAQTGYEINVKLRDYTGDTIYLANYLMDKQYLQDTTTLLGTKGGGQYTFAGEEALPAGMYMVVLPPDNHFFQILINENEQHFSIETDTKNTAADVKIKHSTDNQLFYDYLKFLADQRPLADALRKKLETADEAEQESINQELDKINERVDVYQQKILREHPKSITSIVIGANLPPDMPDFTGDDKEIQLQQWEWMKVHYFDQLDVADPRLLRTPFLWQRTDYYLNKLTVQNPDSISKSMDYILKQMEPNHETWKHYLVRWLNDYSRSKIVGMDAVYVHLAKNYYCNGRTDWVEEEQLMKICDNANTLEPLLIGKIAPNVRMETKDSKAIWLHEIESDYTVLFFWDPNCGHCKKSMPDMIKFYENFKGKGVEVVAVCTKFTEEVKECWETIDERGMGVWLNTVDPYHRSRYKVIYDIRSTPQIYILGDDKEILSKKIGAEQLEEVMQKIIDMRSKK